jgi:hypothetical protein
MSKFTLVEKIEIKIKLQMGRGKGCAKMLAARGE